jgi:hypothetical protein
LEFCCSTSSSLRHSTTPTPAKDFDAYEAVFQSIKEP